MNVDQLSSNTGYGYTANVSTRALTALTKTGPSFVVSTPCWRFGEIGADEMAIFRNIIQLGTIQNISPRLVFKHAITITMLSPIGTGSWHNQARFPQLPGVS